MIGILTRHVRHVQLSHKAFVIRKLIPHFLHLVLLNLLKNGGPVYGSHVLV